jgi:hypothetical protein
MSSSRDIDWVTSYALSHTDGKLIAHKNNPKNNNTPSLDNNQTKKYSDLTPQHNQIDNALACTMFSSLAQRGLVEMSTKYSIEENHTNYPSPSSEQSQINQLTQKTTPNVVVDTSVEDVIVEYIFNQNMLTSEQCFLQLSSYWYRGTFYSPPSNKYDDNLDGIIGNHNKNDNVSNNHNNNNNNNNNKKSPIIGSLLQSLPPSALINILSYLDLSDLLSLLSTSKIFLLSILTLFLSPKYRHSITTNQYLQFQQPPLSDKVVGEQHQEQYIELQNIISGHLTELQKHFLASVSSMAPSTMLQNEHDDLSLDELFSSGGNGVSFGINNNNDNFDHSFNPGPKNRFGSFPQFEQNVQNNHFQDKTTEQTQQKLKSQYLESLLLDSDTTYRLTIHHFTRYEENTSIMPYYYHTYPVYVPKNENNAISKHYYDSDFCYEFPSIETATSSNPAIAMDTKPPSILAQIKIDQDDNKNIIFSEHNQDEFDLNENKIENQSDSIQNQTKIKIDDHVQNDQNYIFKYHSFNQPPIISPQLSGAIPSRMSGSTLTPSQTRPISQSSSTQPTPIPSSRLQQNGLNQAQGQSSLKMPDIINRQNTNTYQTRDVRGPVVPTRGFDDFLFDNDNPTNIPNLETTPSQSRLSTQSQQNKVIYDPNSPPDPSTNFAHDILHEFPHLGQSWGRWSTKRGLLWSLFFLPNHFQRLMDVATRGIASTRQLQLGLAGDDNYDICTYGDKENYGYGTLWNLPQEKLENYNIFIKNIYFALKQKNLHEFLGVHFDGKNTQNNNQQILKATSLQKHIFFRFFSLLPPNSLYRGYIINNDYNSYPQILIPTQISHTLFFESMFANLSWNPKIPLLFHIFNTTIQEKLLPFPTSPPRPNSSKSTSLHNSPHVLQNINLPHRSSIFDLTMDLSHSIMKDCDRTLINKSCRCFFKDKNALYYGTRKVWFSYYYRLSLLHFPIQSSAMLIENNDIKTQNNAYQATAATSDGSSSTNDGGSNNNNSNKRGLNSMRDPIGTQNFDDVAKLAKNQKNSKIIGETSPYAGIQQTNNAALASMMVTNDDLRGCDHCNDLSNSCLCLVLHTLAHLYPDIGYCQGLNFISAQILLQCDVATSFTLLAYLLRYENKQTNMKRISQDKTPMFSKYQHNKQQRDENNDQNKDLKANQNYANFSSVSPQPIKLIQLPEYIRAEYEQEILFRPQAQVEQPLPVCFVTESSSPNSPKNINTQNIKSGNNIDQFGFVHKTVALPHHCNGLSQGYINLVTMNNPLEVNGVNNNNNQNNISKLTTKMKKSAWFILTQPLSKPLQHRLFFTSNLLGWHLAKYIFLTLLRLFLPSLFLNLKKTVFPMALLTDWFMTIFSSPSAYSATPFMMLQPQLIGSSIQNDEKQNKNSQRASSFSPLSPHDNSISSTPTPSSHSAPRVSTRPLTRTQQMKLAQLQQTAPHGPQGQQVPPKPVMQLQETMIEFHAPVATLWDNILLHGDIILYRFVLQLLLLGMKHFQLDIVQFEQLHDFKTQQVTAKYLSRNDIMRRKIFNKIVTAPDCGLENGYNGSGGNNVGSCFNNYVFGMNGNVIGGNKDGFVLKQNDLMKRYNYYKLYEKQTNGNNQNNQNNQKNNKNNSAQSNSPFRIYMNSLRQHSSPVAHVVTDELFNTLKLAAIACLDKTGNKTHAPLFD